MQNIVPSIKLISSSTSG